MSHYPRYVDEAIFEARAAGKRPTDVKRQLSLGTLPGLKRPIQMKERTFWARWGKAGEELRRRQEFGHRDTDEPSIIDKIRAEIESKPAPGPRHLRNCPTCGAPREVVRG